MHWRLKGAIQKTLGCLPGGRHIHYELQRRAGGLADFNRECDMKIADWALMVGHLRASQVPLTGSIFVEMGTGWYPTFPLCLYLGGAARVISLDLNRHLDRGLLLRLSDRLAAAVPAIAQASGEDIGTIAARQAAAASALREGATLGEATGGSIDYRAPADAAATELDAESVDVVFSNSVLEHVPGPVIRSCLSEAMRILRPGGVVFHSVNCGDHYAYVDRSVHQLHYLRYSDRQWRKWNNAFLYQNRLRAVDFVEMVTEAGFRVEIDTSRATPQRLAQLDSIDVHRAFARYTREQLAVTGIDLVGRKPA
jgi:SAM-dependent methyltransferase